MTEQEDIAYLRGQPVPDSQGLIFGDEVRRNGDVFDIDVIRESDGASVGTARGNATNEVIGSAQAIAADT
jgi:hypothetical protein